MAVAGLGDAPACDPLAGGIFRGHQAEIGHQLPRGGEAPKVADLAGQPIAPRLGVIDGVEVFLEHDLLGRMIETKTGEPSPMGLGPMAPATIDPVVPQQKALQPLPCRAQVLYRRGPGPDQVTHRLVRRLGNSNRGQLARPVQPGQTHRVASVGLDMIAGPGRDQRRGHHHAVLPEPGDLTVNAIATGALWLLNTSPVAEIHGFRSGSRDGYGMSHTKERLTE